MKRIFGKQTRHSGELGEHVAERHLRRNRSFRVVARNWRNPNDRREEIDLVGLEGAVLVFVEVKARTGGEPLDAYYAVDWKKRKILRRAIRSFLRQWERPVPSYRFDVVTVDLADKRVRHYENVALFRG